MMLQLRLRRGIHDAVILLLFAVTAGFTQGQAAQRAESIAISSDGRFLGAVVLPASATQSYVIHDGALWLYDFADLLAPPRFLSAQYHAGTELAFSPDGEYVAALDKRGLQVFRTSDGSRALEMKRERNGWSDGIQTISFSPDSATMRGITEYELGEMHLPIWRIETDELTIVARVDTLDYFTKVWFSPDWKQIVAFDQIFEFDIEMGTGESIGTLDFGAFPGYFDDRGELYHERKPLFATATHDCILQIYDTRSWTVVKSWMHPDSDCEYGISAVDFSRAKPWLAFTDHPKYWQWCESSEPARLVVWDYEADALVFEAATYASHSRFTPDDRFIVAIGCRDGNGEPQISVWDTDNGFDFVAYPGANPQLHPDNETMITIGDDGNIWIWNLARRALAVILPALPS